MDNNTQDTQQAVKPISDDQELAKVLAGVSQDVNNLSYLETPAIIPDSKPELSSVPIPQPVSPDPVETYAVPDQASTQESGDSSDLDNIKMDALTELRPLVDKLELEPEEKFDIYLLLLRSTDDKTLIAPAHMAAKDIPDETKRAQALLDVIKEIDYLSTPQS